MNLLSLELHNFRNYRDLFFEPGKEINVLVGANAQGKSNLLESLAYLVFFSSYRTHNEEDIVYFGEPYFSLKAQIQKNNYVLTIDTFYDAKQKKKQVKINGVIQNKLYQGLGTVNTVLFTPEDLYLVKGAPQARRYYLDRESMQLRSSYGEHLRNYQRVLRQRNRLLKDIRGPQKESFLQQLLVWDRQLAAAGSFILVRRKETVKKLSLLARLVYRRLTAGREDLSLAYLSNLNNEELNRKEEEEIFLGALKESREEDLAVGYTTKGPHLDDMEIKINGRAAKIFASQGQQRTAVLSLKMSEVELIKGEKGSYPLLLLDDVFSELDDSRRNSLLDLTREKVQTFITSTSPGLCKNFNEGSTLFKVEGGKVRRGEP